LEIDDIYDNVGRKSEATYDKRNANDHNPYTNNNQLQHSEANVLSADSSS